MVKDLEEIPADILATALQGISAENLQKYYGTTVVEGFESAAEFPILTKGLLSRGYSPEEVKKVIGGDRLRLFQKVWSAET